jgi:hypothetical protein
MIAISQAQHMADMGRHYDTAARNDLAAQHCGRFVLADGVDTKTRYRPALRFSACLSSFAG